MAISTPTSVTDICLAAKAAAKPLAALGSDVKDRALHAIADALVARTPEILEANAKDLEAGRANEIGDALLGRQGRMSRAIKKIGRGNFAYEGVPFALHIGPRD